MSWQTQIFSYFSSYDKRSDTNKNSAGEGTWERYNQNVGKSLDNEVVPLIDNLILNTLDPEFCYPRYVEYLESMMGYTAKPKVLYINSALSSRRNMLKKILKLYKIKGTKRCYEVLFGMMGITMVMTETFGGAGFDSSITLDDPVRIFDRGKCATCSDYYLDLTGASLTPDIAMGINSIIRFCQPYNAILRGALYNGVPLPIMPSFNSSFNSSFNHT